MSDGFLIPRGYEFLERQCQEFLADHPDYDRNIFVMIRYARESRVLGRVDTELRRTLWRHGCAAVRADDKVYPSDRSLWNNVCVYMICCKYGVAVLENRGRDEFNPNVATEYGFMRALNKPVLLLKDRAFNNMRADAMGTVWEEFDITEVEDTLGTPIAQWLKDHDIALPMTEGVHPAGLQREAFVWFRRVLNVWGARSRKEEDDEYWFLGNEIATHRLSFAAPGAPGEAVMALALAEHVVQEHNRKLLPTLAELLIRVIRSSREARES